MGPVHAGDLVPVLDGVLDHAVGEVEQEAFDGEGFACVDEVLGRAEGLAGRLGFGQSRGAVAVGRGAAVGDVQQEDVVPLLGEESDGAAHADFLIVRMRTDDDDVGHVQA